MRATSSLTVKDTLNLKNLFHFSDYSVKIRNSKNVIRMGSRIVSVLQVTAEHVATCIQIHY